MFSELLQEEIDEILEKSAFTHEQRIIFDELCKEKFNTESTMKRTFISNRNKFFKIKKVVISKVIKIIENFES